MFRPLTFSVLSARPSINPRHPTFRPLPSSPLRHISPLFPQKYWDLPTFAARQKQYFRKTQKQEEPDQVRTSILKMQQITRKANSEIKAKEIRLVDSEGIQLGIMPVSAAIRIAQSKGLDVVMVREDLKLPVCRLMKYQQVMENELERKKKQKEDALKRENEKSKNREIRVGSRISEHDLQVKERLLRGFLEAKSHVRISIQFKKPEPFDATLGDMIFENLVSRVEDVGFRDYSEVPVRKGNWMLCNIHPGKPTKKALKPVHREKVVVEVSEEEGPEDMEDIVDKRDLVKRVKKEEKLDVLESPVEPLGADQEPGGEEPEEDIDDSAYEDMGEEMPNAFDEESRPRTTRRRLGTSPGAPPGGRPGGQRPSSFDGQRNNQSGGFSGGQRGDQRGDSDRRGGGYGGDQRGSHSGGGHSGGGWQRNDQRGGQDQRGGHSGGGSSGGGWQRNDQRGGGHHGGHRNDQRGGGGWQRNDHRGGGSSGGGGWQRNDHRGGGNKR